MNARLAVVVTLLSLSACGGSKNPTGPTPPSTPQASSATFVFTQGIIEATNIPTGFQYVFVLHFKETSNTTGATVNSLTITLSNDQGRLGSSVFTAAAFSNPTINAGGQFNSDRLQITDERGGTTVATRAEFLLAFTDGNGRAGTSTMATDVAREPVIEFFTVSRTVVNPGESVTLAWSVKFATTVTISSVGDVPLAGTRTVKPTAAFQVYGLTASNHGASTDRAVSVTVRYPAVEYRVSGTTRTVSVTYATQSGGTGQQANVGTPWSFTWSSASRGDFLYISAQNQQNSGSVTVNIYKDGSFYKSTTSSGAYVIATASGNY